MAEVLNAPSLSPLTDTPPPPRTAPTKPAQSVVPLFLISVLGLFLELLLIRWVTTEIRIFAYLQNTVLVVCFLGLGMGCWDCRRGFALRQLLVPLLILVGLLAVPTTRIVVGHSITELLVRAGGVLVWNTEGLGGSAVVAGLAGIGLTFGLMLLLWFTFVPVGRLLGQLLADHPRPIWAYSVNVAGSLVGIWAFVACSALGLPPGWWFAAFAAGAAYFAGTGGRSRGVDYGLLAGLVGFGALAGYEPGWEETRWSPYQKLTLISNENPPESTFWAKVVGERRPGPSDVSTHFIGVNNTGYQGTINLSASRVESDPKRFPPEQRGYSQYDLPVKFHPNPKSVLIVGAGSGNDVAGALRNGAESVVAVEIDPDIIAFGRKVHPEKPYDDRRVRVVNDDARSYFATSTEKFDVIAFGLLDSHTTNAMTNARLDHYVYTRESLAHAKTLLKPGGVIVLSFEAQKPFIADRMSKGLEEVFGRKPIVFKVPHNSYGWGGVLFVTGDLDAVERRVAEQPRLAALIAGWQAAKPIELPGTTEVPSDDWPYIYLETRHVPALYLLLAAALLALFVVGLRVLKAPQIVRGWDRTQSHFAFLGAGFMLLEVQNISKAAVVLGNTWVVNAVIISGILMMILAANALAGWARRLPEWPVYVALLASCLGLYFLDLSTFAFLPYATKALAVGLLTSLPMLFSGIVFAKSFAATERKDTALGANLFGALAGGMLQSVTFVTGIKALLLIVACFYLAAVLTRPRATPAPTPAPVPA